MCDQFCLRRLHSLTLFFPSNPQLTLFATTKVTGQGELIVLRDQSRSMTGVFISGNKMRRKYVPGGASTTKWGLYFAQAAETLASHTTMCVLKRLRPNDIALE